jgi:hypothetical protein
MLVLLLLLSSMFLQIDAVGEQIDPYRVNIAREEGRSYAPILRAAPTDQDIIRSQVFGSLNEMAANREQNPGVEMYDPAVNRLLDIYLNAADMDQVNQLADLVLQAYNRYTPELQQRGVQMPPLNQLGAEPRIDVSTFRNVGLQASGQPFSPLDADIMQIFNPEIADQRAINLQPLNEANRSNSPYRSPIKYQSSTPLQANEEFQGEGLPGAGAALVTPENISQAARRRLFETSPLVREIQEEIAQNPQEFTTPPTNAGQPRTAEQAGLARRVQVRNVRRRLDLDAPVHQLQYHRDDENGPDGGGVPVN